jgi:Flp pilus assembly protein TadD
MRARTRPPRAHLIFRPAILVLPILIAGAIAVLGAAGAWFVARRGGHLEPSDVRVAGLTLGAAGAAGPDARATSAPRRRLESPIVLIGLDGADWQIIDPLVASGRLPNLGRFKQRAVWGHLRSFEPILSPLLWTTAVTGKPPDEHGIIDFLVPDQVTGRRLPITSRARKVRAVWNIFSERDLSTDVIAWWASWPAERVNGRIVSDRVAYSLFAVDGMLEDRSGLTYPESLWDTLRPEVVDARSISYERIARFADVSRADLTASRRRVALDPETAYKEPINHLARILASTETYHHAALRLLLEGQPDLFAVYYQGIDEVCHRFAHFMPPKMAMVSTADFAKYRRAVEEFYVYQDGLLGELLESIASSSTVIVMSDHGFQNGASRPTDGPADIEGKPGKWHRLYGIVMVAGPGIGPGRFDTATLYDITPTILTLAGLPEAGDMRGRPLLKKSSSGSAPQRIASYETGGQGRAGEVAAGGAPSGRQKAPEEAPELAPELADEELLRNLASLGYIGGAPARAEAAPSPGNDAPQTVTAHTNLASLLLQKGDLEGAERELRKALELKAGYFPALMTLSQVLVRQRRLDEALDATRRAVAGTDDAEDAAYVQLALLAIRAGQSKQAENFLEALGERRPRASGIETALGVLALGGEGSAAKVEAQRRFRSALAIEPASPEAMGRLFSLYREQGREAELEGAVRAALRVNDRSVMHRNWLGLILLRKGEPAAAEAEFRGALELAPDFPGTMANLGSLYGRIGRLEEAASVLSRALRIDPKNPEARVNLGAALAKLGRLDEAISSLEEARRMGIRSPELLNAVGLAYAQRGRKREAIEALEESLTLSPEQPQVKSLLSELTRPA